MQGKCIPHLHFIQCRKKLCGRQSPVTGKDRVRAFAADGERASRHVPCRNLQDALVHAVIDRQLHMNLRNLQIAHNSGAGDIQFPVIPGKLRIIRVKPVRRLIPQPGIVDMGGPPHLFQPLLLHPVHLCGIIRNHP